MEKWSIEWDLTNGPFQSVMSCWRFLGFIGSPSCCFRSSMTCFFCFRNLNDLNNGWWNKSVAVNTRHTFTKLHLFLFWSVFLLWMFHFYSMFKHCSYSSMIVEKTQLLINHSWTFINILEVLDLHGRCLQCSCPDSGVGKNSNSPLSSFATAWYTKYILFRCWEPKGGLLQQFLGGGNSNVFLFSPLPGEIIQFDEHLFQMGWFNHQLEFVSKWQHYGSQQEPYVHVV